MAGPCAAAHAVPTTRARRTPARACSPRAERDAGGQGRLATWRCRRGHCAHGDEPVDYYVRDGDAGERGTPTAAVAPIYVYSSAGDDGMTLDEPRASGSGCGGRWRRDDALRRPAEIGECVGRHGSTAAQGSDVGPDWRSRGGDVRGTVRSARRGPSSCAPAKPCTSTLRCRRVGSVVADRVLGRALRRPRANRHAGSPGRRRSGRRRSVDRMRRDRREAHFWSRPSAIRAHGPLARLGHCETPRSRRGLPGHCVRPRVVGAGGVRVGDR